MLYGVYEYLCNLFYVISVSRNTVFMGEIDRNTGTIKSTRFCKLEYIKNKLIQHTQDIYDLYLNDIDIDKYIRTEYTKTHEYIYDILTGEILETNKIIPVNEIFNFDNMYCEHGTIKRYGIELEAVRINKHIIDNALNISKDATFVPKSTHKLCSVEQCNLKQENKHNGNICEHKVILSIGNKKWTTHCMYTEIHPTKPTIHYISNRKAFRNAHNTK